MNMTKQWVLKQIKEYQILVSGLNDNEPLDKKLKEIWQATLHTLNATLKVINLELQNL